MNHLEKEISEHFPSLQKELVQQIAEVGELRTFREGEVLMRTGQYIRNVMLVLDGLVKIYREDDEGNEFFMYYLEGGKACALSMICATKQDTSELTAKALTDTTVIAIPLQYMDQWMTQYKSWYHFVVGTYRDRFEELLQTIDHIAFRNMDERLVFYLKRHQEKLKTNIIPLSHAEIAQDLNSSREVITRLLKKLADRGYGTGAQAAYRNYPSRYDFVTFVTELSFIHSHFARHERNCRLHQCCTHWHFAWAHWRRRIYSYCAGVGVPVSLAAFDCHIVFIVCRGQHIFCRGFKQL